MITLCFNKINPLIKLPHCIRQVVKHFDTESVCVGVDVSTLRGKLYCIIIRVVVFVAIHNNSPVV